jgi:hypothetical protein
MVQDPDAGERPDVIAELKRLGRQLGETLDAAWGSQERKRAEEELKAGARAFAEEFERAVGRARGARPGEVTSKARRTIVDGLRWMSSELEGLADRFTSGEEAGKREAGNGPAGGTKRGSRKP